MNTYVFVCRLTNSLTCELKADDIDDAWDVLKIKLNEVEVNSNFKMPALNAWILVTEIKK